MKKNQKDGLFIPEDKRRTIVDALEAAEKALDGFGTEDEELLKLIADAIHHAGGRG